MIRLSYDLTNFFEDYSKNEDSYILIIRIGDLGRKAKDILITLEKLQMQLPDLNNEFIIEKYNSRQSAVDRYNQLEEIKSRIEIWLYHAGRLISSKSFW